MGFHYMSSSCRYFVFCTWIGHLIKAQMVTHVPISDLSQEHLSVSTSSFFYQRPEFPRDCQEVRQKCLFQNKSGVYIIRPDGFSDPFEVFCDNSEINSDGSWMIILNRFDGFVANKRTWDEYKNGFGFLGSEFWLGNDKIAHVTNQKQYELRIDIVSSNGSSFYIKYDKFRISDEWSGYTLTSLGVYSGTADSFVTTCKKNMEFGPCACQGTCDQPEVRNGCNNECVHGEGCVCPDGFLFKGRDCVPKNECGCFVQEGRVIPNGDTYVNPGCSSRCTCNNDVLTCKNYTCSLNANCEERNNIRMCYCKDGFEGDGQTCTAFLDCFELYNSGNRRDAVYAIHPSGWSGESFQVYCDMTTGNGGWTVFQRRKDGSTSFHRNWSSYKQGFGDLTGEFWLGNDKLHVITSQKNYQLRIKLRNSAGSTYYALYNLFRVSDEGDNYKLVGLGSYTGTAGFNGMNSRRNQPFSTFDNDNEISTHNCAQKHTGGWWHGYVEDDDGLHCYSNAYCFRWRQGSQYCSCEVSNLNGNYNSGNSQSIFWHKLPGNECNIKFTEMKLRPI